MRELTDNEFHQEVDNSKLPYLVDFWAIWCAPCATLSQTLEEIAIEFEGKLNIGKVNVDNEIKTANEFEIQNIPTIILFKHGKELERIVGAIPKEHLIKKIKKTMQKGEGTTKRRRSMND